MDNFIKEIYKAKNAVIHMDTELLIRHRQEPLTEEEKKHLLCLKWELENLVGSIKEKI